MKKLLYLIIAILLISNALALSANPNPLIVDAIYGDNEFTFNVENTNNFSVSNIKIELNNLIGPGFISTMTINPNNFNLGKYENKTVTLKVDIPESKKLGIYTGTVSISNKTYSTSLLISLNLVSNFTGPEITSFSPQGGISSSSVMMQVETDKKATCKYSSYQGRAYDSMEGTFDYNFEILHKESLTNLIDGIYKYYVKCKDELGNAGQEKEILFSVSIPATAQIVLSEQSPLKSGKIKISLITSKVLSQTPSLSYSFDGISYSPIPLIGSGKSWTGYIIIPSNLGEKVGSFKFAGRDLEGNLGSEITSGGVFLIDTVKPKAVSDIESYGDEQGIRLKWYYEEEFESFNIYRSENPGVDYVDYYKNSYDKKFLDTDVEKGKKYYYKISVADEAGNEADLSREVSATSLLGEPIQEGLSLELIGKVDNLISEINFVENQANNIKNSINAKQEKEKQLFLDLELGKEIDTAKTDLSVLKRDIEQYKSQDLTEIELDNKLNSAKVKLNIIKKRIPESISIIDEVSETNEITNQQIEQAILEINPDILESIKEKSIAQSVSLNKEISIESFAYLIEILYLDGTTSEITVIRKIIESGTDEGKLIEIIPKHIAEQVAELNIKTINYDVIKSDPVLSFASNTEKIVYTLNKRINLNDLNEILLIPVSIAEQESIPATGYFVLDLEQSNYLGMIIGGAVLLSLIIYFVYLKKKKLSVSLIKMKSQLKKAEDLLKKSELQQVKEIYREIMQEYNELTEKEKQTIYPKIEKLLNKIKNGK